MKPLKDLFEYELCLLYDAEQKAVRGLGRMATKCGDPDLVQVFKDYQAVSAQRVERLDAVFGQTGISPRREPCNGINGLIEEFSDFLKTRMPQDVCDVFAVESARRVERYLICLYQALITLSVALGTDEVTEALAANMTEHLAGGDGFKALSINLTEKLISPLPE